MVAIVALGIRHGEMGDEAVDRRSAGAALDQEDPDQWQERTAAILTACLLTPDGPTLTSCHAVVR